MNYRRWIVVGFVIALSIFSFYHLCTSGDDYQFLTTSDSGYFYGIAREINHNDGFIEKYSLSHPLYGKPVSKTNQFHPLLLVTFYRGLHAVNPSVTLQVAAKYYAPLLFALAVIGAFLAARELGGDLAGCGSALFFATLTGSMYWSKIGAFDREVIITFFGVWLLYLIIKVFRAHGRDILKYSALAGLLYGLFLITWPGAPFLGVIVGLALVLLFLEKAVSGLGFIATGILSLWVGSSFAPFDVAELIGIFTILAGSIRLAKDWESIEIIEKKLVSSLRSNLRLIGGVLAVLGIATIVIVLLGGSSPSVWLNTFTKRIPSFLGLGQGGVSFPSFATEMRPALPSLGNYFKAPAMSTNPYLVGQLYGNAFLVVVTMLLIAAAMVKVFSSSKNAHYLAFSWLLVLAPMPLAQGRFFRLFWPMWPVLAGFGLGVCLIWARKIIFSPSFAVSEWIDKARHPLVLALVFIILISPFIHNARDHAGDRSPSPHAGSLAGGRYFDLLECCDWIENRTEGLPPEDSIVGIRWSYGHFVTGASGRPSFTDGAQTTGFRDEWQDSEGIKPPDYIKFIDDGNGKIIGMNAPIRENEVNGRRIDMRRLYEADVENFAKIIKLYEQYGVGLDYCVFDLTSRSRWESQALMANMKNVRNPDNSRVSIQQQNMQVFQYNFGNNKIFLVLSQKGYQAYLQVDNTQVKVGILLRYLRLTNNQKVKIEHAVDLTDFNPENFAHKTLILDYKYSGFRNRGLLMSSQKENVPRARLADYEIPVISRVKYGYELPSYIGEIYRPSPEQNFVVAEINDEEL